MDNYYEYSTGEWVTDWDRYRAIADQPQFADLFDNPDSEEAWSLILDLLAAVPEDTVHFVGSGPLESFVNAHGTAFIDRLVSEAARNARFRRAALEINLARGRLPDSIEAQLLHAFGPRFKLLEPDAG
jgi:uncharacterized protein DUF6869